MLKDSKGNAWFGTNRGLYKYDGKNFKLYGIAQGLSRESITSICEDKNSNLWFGMEYDSLVNKMEFPDSDNGGHIITRYNIHQGSIASTNCIKKDKKNNLWFATTNAGVVKFDGKTFTRYTTAQGLSNNNVSSIVEDNDDNLWLLTYNGLCKMRAQQGNKEGEKIQDQTPGSLFTNYLYADGFLGIGGDFNSLLLDKNGNIWAGTTNRVTRYDPETDIPDSDPPNIQLSGLSLFGENINWLDLEKKKDTTFALNNGVAIHDCNFTGLSKWYNLPQELDLAYNNNYVTFQFVGITTNKPGHVRYQYRLEGLDENWSSITENPYATYSNLPYGSYTFKVKAANSEGHWSNEFSYPFTIRPPWWKTWWFRTMAVGFLIALIYAVVRWQLHYKFRLQLERSEKEKQLAELKQQASELEMHALRAQMNPHFIFNSLNSINRFILQNNKTEASEYLTKFSKLVRMILQNSQHPLIPLESELEALKLYLDLEALRFEHHFEYRISVPNDLDVDILKVPPLIIQPYAENAIWHGLMHKEEKGHLEIEVSVASDHLLCKIIDDGIGRKLASMRQTQQDARHKSMGLKMTADRITMLQRLNRDERPVAVNDLVNPDGTPAGTEVIIKMPLIYD
jgi:streptogramin lyase